jgi:signal transduction histidine kinase
LLADATVQPEKRRVYQDAEVRATDRLQRLVEALLDFGRMESGHRPYRFERLSAGSLAQDLVEEFRREAVPRDFVLHCTVDGTRCMVDADPEALSRALWNLLDNAVKYGGDNRKIQVIVQRDGAAVHLTIRDHGLGIPAGERKRIFEKFVRGEVARSQGIKGTGIGLAMVKHIVEAHGGRIDVESTLGKGSAFTNSLPASE